MKQLKKSSGFLNDVRLRSLGRILDKVNALANTMASMPDSELRSQTGLFKERLTKGESLDSLLPEAFATIREASKRILKMYPFDVQVLGGIALHKGFIAEMKTGEGKTLTATLPLYLNALSGKGAILVTTNDYLARRDAEEMGPLFEWLGLSVGIDSETGAGEEAASDNLARKKAVYNADITYTTNFTLGFDYLTNNLVGSEEEKFLRPFNYVIVDEADAVLLDTAQTPLIISGSPRIQSNLYDICYQFILSLEEDEEYIVDDEKKFVHLTGKGSSYAEEYFDIADLYDEKYFELNRHINLALRAQHLYKINRDYVVMGDEVKLLDNRSGRTLEGTRLQSGLHQAIETKEGVRKTKESRAMGSVTYQALFNLFPKLAGMTGTGLIAEDEFISTYKLPVVVIPTNTPTQRMDYPDKIYITLPEKLYATIECVKEIHATGQPILLVSGTVEIAEIYSQMLLQEGIAHSVLTANNVAKEALIIKEAGQLGNVTVATPLAGRGTDIKLGPGVKELGGLAVIGTERMPNGRIDWQLRGRAGRQGDPGSSQFFVSLEDELLIKYGSKRLNKFFKKNNHSNRENYGLPLTGRKYIRAIENAQQKSEDGAASSRNSTIQFDESMKIQRKKIYELRDRLMDGETRVSEKVDEIFEEVITDYTKQPNRDLNSLKRYILENFTYDFKHFPSNFNVHKNAEVKSLLLDLYRAEFRKKEKELDTEKQFADFQRLSMLKAIDECWIEQVDNLQQLKGVVSTRQLAQKNGVFEYYQESLSSYQKLSFQVKCLIVRNIMLSSVQKGRDGEVSIYFA